MIVSSSRKAKKGKTAGPWEHFQIKWGQSVEEKNAPPRWYLVKGQLISVSSNLLKDQQFFLMISALAAKKRSIQRNKVTLLEDFILTLLHYILDLTSFYKLGQKYKDIFLHFLVQM